MTTASKSHLVSHENKGSISVFERSLIEEISTAIVIQSTFESNPEGSLDEILSLHFSSNYNYIGGIGYMFPQNSKIEGRMLCH